MRIKEDIKVLKNWTMNMNQIKCVYTGGPAGCHWAYGSHCIWIEIPWLMIL